jgi:hypothetical protein
MFLSTVDPKQQAPLRQMLKKINRTKKTVDNLNKQLQASLGKPK